MFTGIIKKIGTILLVEEKNQSLFLTIGLSEGWKLQEGQSININGICSTVRNVAPQSFQVEYMPETLKKTTAASWLKGDKVNLEQSLRLTDLVDGHLVSGHVDTTGKIVSIEQKGDSHVFTIQVPKNFMPLIAPKGSVALDGVSLTVVDAVKDCFSVSLVSYTLENTTFGNKKIGNVVNVETDLLAKYIQNLIG